MSNRISIPWEARAAGESSTGGNLVKPDFAASVWKLLKEFQAIVADAHLIDTPTGAPYGVPVYSSYTASGAAQTENAQVADGSPGASTPLVAFPSLVQFGLTPSYGARVPVSMQLLADGVDVSETIASAVAESIGRQVASVVSTALYGSATTGQEVSLGTVTNSNVAKLLAALDPAFLPAAKLYVSAADFALLAEDDPTKLRNFPVPVVVTNAATVFSSGTVSGPVLACLDRTLLLRRAADVDVIITPEVGNGATGTGGGDMLSQVLVAWARFDVKATGQVTSAVFSK